MITFFTETLKNPVINGTLKNFEESVLPFGCALALNILALNFATKRDLLACF